jgi:ribonuclease R
MNKDTVLEFFKEHIKKPLSFREILALMHLSRAEGRALKRLLRELIQNGDIVRTRKGLYGPARDMNLENGYLELHKDGYGFVILERPGERDLFIPARSTMGGLNNDRVLVRIENRRRREGRIIRILERAQNRIAGKFEVSRTGLYVKPKDRSIAFDLSISPAHRGNAQHGDAVLAEIVNYPTDRKPPSGKIIKILGRPADPQAEIEAIIDEFNLPRKFPAHVLAEAKLHFGQQTPVRLTGKAHRKDLRHLLTVTIDGEQAKDFDDAVSVRLSPHGYTLYVHIADVGFYVGWDDLVDIEARKRGTSVYFPGRVLPMLPKVLSEDLCSLKPKTNRFAFTAEMDFDRYGTRLQTAFYPSIITSNDRMTYTAVKKILVENNPQARTRYQHLLQDLELMGELCGILRQKRLDRGSLDFDLPEPEVLLDLQGKPEAILRAERNYAHMIIEEFMIAANEAVAEHLEAKGIPVLFRVHEEPDSLKLDEIVRVMNPGPKRKKSLRPGDIPKLLQTIQNTPGQEIIHSLVLRSLKQARYSHINAGHFGLASKSYTHFTSPIRRYPDLVVHRILREVTGTKRVPDKRIQGLGKILPDIAFHSSRMERLADKAEREVVNAMRVWFMRDKLGEEFRGSIVRVSPYGVKVRLRDFFVEGILHVSFMTDDFYQFNERTMSLIGRNTKRAYSLGDELTVRVDRIDMEEREIILDVV